MGGNALQTLNNVRLPRQDYLKLEAKVYKVLQPFYEEVHVPRYLETKPDFGDVDFLCLNSNNDHNETTLENGFPPRQLLKTHTDIKSKEIKSTSKTSMSFEVDGFQVDLNLYNSRDEFETDKFLMSFGGIANMIGFMFQRLKLKWNRTGLCILASSDLVQPANFPIQLCTNVKEVCHEIGLDWDKWIHGFSRAEQVYEFLAECNLLHFDIIQDAIPHKANNCDKERPIVANFFRYLNQNRSHTHRKQFKENEFHSYLIERFNQAGQLDYKWEEYKRKQNFKQLFNGRIVQDITGLSGGGLGEFIVHLKQSKNDEEFEQFILQGSPDTIEKFIQEKFKVFTTNRSN